MVLQGSTYLPFVHSFCARLVTCSVCASRSGISTMSPVSRVRTFPLRSTPDASGSRRMGGIVEFFVLMMHPSCHSGPPLLPKPTWFHYEVSVECDSHSLVDMLSERWCLKFVSSLIWLQVSPMAYYPPAHEARSPAAPVANCSNKQLKFDHSYSKQSSAWARSRSDLILRKSFNASLYVI